MGTAIALSSSFLSALSSLPLPWLVLTAEHTLLTDGDAWYDEEAGVLVPMGCCSNGRYTMRMIQSAILLC